MLTCRDILGWGRIVRRVFGSGGGGSRARRQDVGRDRREIRDHLWLLYRGRYAGEPHPGSASISSRRASSPSTGRWSSAISRPQADSFQPGDAEALLAFANKAGLPVHGHALAWNESRPGWLMALSSVGKQKALDSTHR